MARPQTDPRSRVRHDTPIFDECCECRTAFQPSRQLLSLQVPQFQTMFTGKQEQPPIGTYLRRKSPTQSGMNRVRQGRTDWRGLDLPEGRFRGVLNKQQISTIGRLLDAKLAEGGI